MGGGAMDIDLPMIQFCSSSSKLSSSSSSSSTSSSSNLNFPVSANNNSTNATLKQSCGTASSCEKVDGTEEKRASGLLDITVFGHLPSKLEVECAVAALQSFMRGISSSGSEFRWLQPWLGSLDQGYGRRVYDTFRLLLTDPTVKRLVISLASDRAFWNAVMNNELVRKLLDSPYSAENGRNHQSSGEEPNMAADILKWILDTTKAKVMELIEKFQALMDEIFRPLDSGDQNPTEETRGDLEDKVRSSFLLSIVVLVIVIVARAHS